MTLRAAPYPANTKAKGWRFELDTEKIDQSDTWDLAKPEVRPWLLMLWMTAWRQVPCGSLPDDGEIIAAKIGMPMKAFEKARGVLLRGWWKADDGRLYQSTIVDRVLDMLDKRGSNAERAARARARKSLSPACDAEVTRDSADTNGEPTREFDTRNQNQNQISNTSPDGDVSTTAAVAVGSSPPPQPARGPDTCPHQDIIALYHELLPMCPRVRDWTDARAQALRTRWREKPERQNLDWWREFFAYIERDCPFLVGRKNTPNRRPFLVSLEWIVTLSNFVKITEGQYEEDRQEAQA